MFFLKTLGEIISKLVYKFVYVVETRIFGRRNPQKLKTKTFCLAVLLMFFSLCVAGLLQKYLQGWTFVEGIYAWFATFSTIGYGDYIPTWDVLRELDASKRADRKIETWLIFSSLALPPLAGLCVVSGVLNSLVEALEELKIQFNARNKCARRIRRKSAKLDIHNQNAKRLRCQRGNTVFLTIVKQRHRSASI